MNKKKRAPPFKTDSRKSVLEENVTFHSRDKTAGRPSSSCFTIAHPPVVNVVVLPSPAPVLVWKAVDLQKLLFTETRNASKVAGVGQPAGEEEGGESTDEEVRGGKCKRGSR